MFFKHGHDFVDGKYLFCQCLETDGAAHHHCIGRETISQPDDDTPITSPILDPTGMAMTSIIDAVSEPDTPVDTFQDTAFADGESGGGGAGADFSSPSDTSSTDN